MADGDECAEYVLFKEQETLIMRSIFKNGL
jgi:hypothetical protein